MRDRENQKQNPKWQVLLCVLILLLLYCLIRAHRASYPYFLHGDEYWHYMLKDMTFKECNVLIDYVPWPPFSVLVYKSFTHIPGFTLFMGRAISIGLSLLATLLAARFMAKTAGWKAGIIFLMLVSSLPIEVNYSSFLRPYGLIFLGLVFQMHYAQRVVTAGDAKSLAGFVTSALFLIHSHYWNFFIIGGVCACVMIHLLQVKQFAVLGNLLLLMALVGLSFIVNLPQYLFVKDIFQSQTSDTLNAKRSMLMLWYLAGGKWNVLILVAACFSTMFLDKRPLSEDQKRFAWFYFWLFVSCFLFTLLYCFARKVGARPQSAVYYFIPITIAFSIWLSRMRSNLFFCLLTLCLSLSALHANRDYMGKISKPEPQIALMKSALKDNARDHFYCLNYRPEHGYFVWEKFRSEGLRYEDCTWFPGSYRGSYLFEILLRDLRTDTPSVRILYKPDEESTAMLERLKKEPLLKAAEFETLPLEDFPEFSVCRVRLRS